MSNWRLEGLDTFENETYPLEGEYAFQQEAESAASERLAELEQDQPTESSGGQAEDGIQDRIFIIRPDGTKYRYSPITSVDCEVVLKETANDLIAQTADGKKVSISTGLPDVREGHKGKLLTFEGKTVFIREPYAD